MIPASVATLFSRGIQSRGAEYEADGRVLLMSAPPSIRATVAGSIDYTVWIDLARGRRWAMSCSCPFAHDRGVCKHIWAVLLAADKLGYLSTGTSTSPAETRPRPVPDWKRRLHALRTRAGPETDHASAEPWPEDRRIIYLLVLDETARVGDAVIDVMTEPISDRGSSGPFSFSREAWLRATDPLDRQIAHLLLGTNIGAGSPQSGTHRHRFVIPASMYETTLRAICESGRCFYSMSARGSRSPTPITWDDGPPWSVQCRVVRDAERDGWRLDGVIQRAGEQLPLEEVELMTDTGLLMTGTKVARLDAEGARSLFPLLDPRAPLIVRDDELFDLVAELHLLPSVPKIELPDGVRIEHARPIPTPHLRIGAEPYGWSGRDRLVAELHFDYDGHHVPYAKRGRPIVDAPGKRIVHRNPEFEKSALKRVLALGVRREEAWESGKPELVVSSKLLATLVEDLTQEGWQVDAEGKRYRTADRTSVNVSSGIDWFELHGTAEFGDQQVALPRLLEALRRRERSVLLDDGTHGLLPEEWLERFAKIAALTTESVDGESIRFTLAQTALLDALLATLPEPRVDETFARIRDELRQFDAISPVDPPATFTGILRPYQREGLGWMLFLRRFALGGCLADDMGLGKTVQVLALLERMRVDGAGPSLLVVPKSLVFNWQREAARFTPGLRVRDYTGNQRRRAPLDTNDFDLLVTTYGTLRRDAPVLRELEFEYIVLDEAQAIKNAKTASAKAARLLRARNRLAMSGTPIENRVEELWSIFDFLNPGMLGASSALSALKSTDDPATNGAGRSLIARALRPFILRRTKQQVAPDLPARLEQTLIVELEKDQRALYDELRLHYRRALLPRVEQLGTQRTQFEILEALLRLRQAACHPGLIDATKANLPSAKLETLVSQLAEIVAEGHKALVFSQFTSFLALVRARLDADGIVYEYLDGKTTDRQQRVDRFQTDTTCPVFLISLRAGGYGLNLTAADYVFLLDPWWNPAVEAQAIDRTHRIGQERQVFAMRLIARDTVEEKVLALQDKKRELVDAILNAEAGGLAAIRREELELLLG